VNDLAPPPHRSRLAASYGVTGAVLGFLGVAAGAFGAHELKSILGPAQMSAFETGARYQLVHAVALVAVSLALERGSSRPIAVAGALFIIGVVLFSGSLYALAMFAPWWGIVTPFGGLCLLNGWLCLAVGFARRRA